MAGRNPNEANKNFVEPLRDAIKCVTKGQLSTGGPRQSLDSQPLVLTLNKGYPSKLNGDTGLKLKMSHHYRIVQGDGDRGPWKVTTVAYYYEIQNRQGSPLLAYHWDPRRSDTVIAPHLHLYVGNNKLCSSIAEEVGCLRLDKKHLPTDRVSLEQVLRLLITEFGVIPTQSNWASILDRGEEIFKEWRTWPQSRGSEV